MLRVVYLLVSGCLISIDSCKPYDTIWGHWSTCTHTCGGGRQERSGHSCVWHEHEHDSRNCNEFCYNGGNFYSGQCHCSKWRKGRCCEDCNYDYSITNCKYRSVSCGGSPDNIQCTNCLDPFYSGGYGKGCILCPPIAHCKDRHCTHPGNNKCLKCIEDNSYFKRTHGDTQCERLCAWNNNYCWPGSCSDNNLAKDCQCAIGFDKVYNNTETSCQLSSTNTTAISTCETWIHGPNGEIKQANSIDNTRECDHFVDFYGNFQPRQLTFDLAANFLLSLPKTLKQPHYISEFTFGLTDVKAYVQIKSVTGSDTDIASEYIHTDNGTGTNAVSTVFHKSSLNLTLATTKNPLRDGEWLCVNYEAKAGGYLKSFDLRQNDRKQSQPVPYRKIKKDKRLCYRYDNNAPKHCSESNSCIIEPIQISKRITRSPIIPIEFKGWFDPIPNKGTNDHASGIDTYEITVHNVDPSSGTVKVITTESPVFLKQMNRNVTSMVLNLTSNAPRLFAISLEIKDVADNVQHARRFVLIDNSSSIATDKTKSFYVESASKETNLTWQTHHNDICIAWKNYFYNKDYPENSFLNPVEPDPLGLYSGIYDQTEQPLPISGTPNVYGIVKFFFSWQRNNANLSNEIIVPNLKAQRYCRSFDVRDGDTYEMNIRAVDVVNNTYAENRTVHIDRSAPHINDLCLTIDGEKQLFVHNQIDLSKMKLYFESFDPHSGITTVEWAFGISDGGKELVMGHTSPVKLTKCPDNESKCYCPDVGDCEIYAYYIDLNALIKVNKEIGNHNRNYFFTIKVTNHAQLTNIEHLDILVDDSPPAVGVVFEGPLDSPDIDYTSDDSFLVHWHGFIDHESDIRRYKVGVSNYCLNYMEMTNMNITSSLPAYFELPYTEVSVKITVNFTSPKMFTTIAAVNNALDISDVACTDGIIRDTLQPKIRNVTVQNSKWSETIICHLNKAFLMQSNLKIMLLHQTESCIRRCKLSSIQYAIYDILPNENARTLDAEAADFLCSILPSFNSDIIAYLPHDHLDLKWDVQDGLSQIENFYIGIANDASEIASPGIINYTPTNKRPRFRMKNIGVGSSHLFYVLIKAINKAGLSSVASVGPLLVDETPPQTSEMPRVNITTTHVILSWRNDTFYDLDQREQINQLYFEIASRHKPVTPLMEWRLDTSSKCLNSIDWCIEYPLQKLQQHDTDTGLEFYFKLYVYNNAGHLLKLETEKFKIPSKYPPGNAIVYDVDPKQPKDSKDVDIHFTSSNLCARWEGFNHHEQLKFEVGVGTSRIKDNVLKYRNISNITYMCFNSTKFLPNVRYHILVKASCSGGQTTSVSDGVIIVTQNYIDSNLKVHAIRECNTADSLTSVTICHARNGSILFQNTSLQIGAFYQLYAPVNVNISAEEDQGIVKELSRDPNGVSYLIVPVVEKPMFSGEMGIETSSVNITKCPSKTYYKVGSKSITSSWDYQDKNMLSLEYEVTLQQHRHQGMNSSHHRTILYRAKTKTMSHLIRYNFTKANVSYKVFVSPCLGNQCLQPVSTELFTITQPPLGDISMAKMAHDDEKGCLMFQMEWKAFTSTSPLLFYQWSVCEDMSSKHMISTWKTKHDSGDLMKVQQCLNLPITAHKSMFGCVRGFAEDGQIKSTCKEIQRTTPEQFRSNDIYDVDVTGPIWKLIKETITSSNIGEISRLLYDSEIDFGILQSRIAGVILYGSERKIDWFLMKVPNVPVSCDYGLGCFFTQSTYKGYIEIEQKILQPNTVYYICAASNVTYIEREFFTEKLNEIRSCSDGFLIDDTPPRAGKVFVPNTNGYITDLSYIEITWDQFYDNINASHFGRIGDIQSYSFGIGTRPEGDDLVQYTDVGRSKETSSNLKGIADDTVMFVSIKAIDYAGLTVEATSPALIVDTSPPIVGTISINNNKNTRFINSLNIDVRLDGFHDKESGVDLYELCIGTSLGLGDVIPLMRTSEYHLEMRLPNDKVHDGHEYFINCKVTNRAGLSSTFVTKRIVVDLSEPTGGQVIDGNYLLKLDQEFQEDVHHISVHWKGFDDIHSGLHLYRVGLGSEPFQDDIGAMVETGLIKETTWNGSFVPGSRYYSVVEACNKAGLCTKRCSNGIVLDNSPPLKGLVKVGTASHQHYIPKSSSIQMHWYGFEDPQSDLDHFETCLGTIQGQCDILPYFHCLLHSSIIKTGLSLPINISLYATVRVYNKAGMNVSQNSDAFLIDETPPVMISKPKFVIDNTSILGYSEQWEPSILSLVWQFKDQESPIVSHTITLMTHHEGHTPVEKLELGSETSTTIVLDQFNWLKNGDRYYFEVTCCNAAGHCSTSSSHDLLIDSSPPHLGGFKPPMTWKTAINSNGHLRSEISLTWYGFHDQESGIRRYFITVSRTYSGSELSNGEITFAANQSVIQDDKIILHDVIKRDDKIILAIWAQNSVGLNSTIARVSVDALSISTTPPHTEGILELEKHSCETHYCNKDCTCAVIGKPCTSETNIRNCTNMDIVTIKKQNLPIVAVYGGLGHSKFDHTASSACLTGHWKSDGNGVNVSRYEWSMGLLNQPIGEGIFDLKKEIPWRDVGLRTQTVYCLPTNHSLIHGEQYLVYVRVWYSPENSAIFKSNPIHIDQTPPALRRGKFIKDSDTSCKADFDYIDWMDTITACWENVFREQDSVITHYIASLGTSPKSDDIYRRTNVFLNTSVTLTKLGLAHGTTYYFNIICYNSLGMHNSLSSDGFKVDMDMPISGVVFNTIRHKNLLYQSGKDNISLSWHGFIDHHSGIKTYMTAILEENQLDTASPTFTNVGLSTSYTFQRLNIEHGKRYVGIVKAVDAAGHESNFSISPAIKLDWTPPHSLQCSRYINILDENITCSTDSTYSIIKQISLAKNHLYRFTGIHKQADSRTAALLKIGRFEVELPFSLRFDQSVTFKYVHRPVQNSNPSIQITGVCRAKSLISIIIGECSDDAYVKYADVDLKQIRESVISVDITIVDDDSHIKKIYIGLGTTRGGFQIKPLSRFHGSTNVFIDVDVAHSTPIYATVIAENHAGLRAVFYSSVLVMDKTAPTFSKKPKLHTEVNNSKHDFHVEWDVDDAESGIQQCLCAIGNEYKSLELKDFVPTESNKTCRLNNVTVEHGEIIFAHVLCVNGRDMESRAFSNPVYILIDPPASNKASVQFVPSNTEVNDVPFHDAHQPIQSNLSFVQLQWNGFEGNYKIDHYEYCLEMDSAPILDWTSAEKQTMVASSGLYLQSGSAYTAKVKAFVSNRASESIECQILVLGSAPKLTGKSIQMSIDGQEITFEWSKVYESFHNVMFFLTIGSKLGFSDIIDYYRTDQTSFSFNIPKSTVISPRVTEVFIDLTCSYMTGMSSSYKTSYTLP